MKLSFKIHRPRLERYTGYELLYLLSYALLITVFFLNTSLFSLYVNRILLIAYLCCIAILTARELIYTESTKRRFAAVVIGFFMSVIAVFFARTIAFAMTIVMIALVGRIKPKTILNLSIVLMSLLAIFVIASASVGIIKDTIYYQEERIRRTFGFRYVLVLPTYFFNFTAILVFLRREKIGFVSLAVLAGVDYLIYRYTNSRLTFGTTLLIIVYALFYKLRVGILKKNPKMGKWWCLSIPVYLVFGLFSLYLSVNYNPYTAWQGRLNKILGGRLGIAKRSYEIYGITLFGNPNIDWVGQGLDIYGKKPVGEVTYVDNLYFSLLQQYGIIVFVVLMILLTYMMYRCYKNGDKILMVILIILALHGLIDSLIQQLQYNSFLFCIYYLCFNKAYIRRKQPLDIKDKSSICLL